MSAIEDLAGVLANALLRHAHLLATSAHDSDAAAAGSEVGEAARQYALLVSEQYGWSSPFPGGEDGGDDEEVDAENAGLVEAMDVTAVVVAPAPAADFDGAARKLHRMLETFFDTQLPDGYRATEVGVFPRPGPAPAEPGRAGRPL